MFSNQKHLAFSYFGLITLLACAIRVILASQDLNFIDRTFLPDDAFYTLSIARSIAMGYGPSTDLIHLTNGFQPLIAFIQSIIFYLGYQGDQALTFAVFISSFFGGLSTFLIGYILLNVSNIKTAIIGCLLWASAPFIIIHDLNSLETSLSGFLSLFIILITIINHKEKKLWQLTFLAVACSLALLARIDNCFLLITVGYFAFRHWGWRQFIYIAGIALLLITPWWIYSLTHFNYIIPISGKAVKFITDINQMSLIHILFSGLYALSAWLPFFEFNSIASNLMTSSVFIILLSIYAYNRIKPYSILFIIPSVSIFLFYVLYLPAFWFFYRYFYFIYISILIFLSIFLGDCLAKKFKKIALGLTIFFLFFYSIEILSYFFKLPNLASSNGYRKTALQIKKELNKGDVVGSMQSGALGYYFFPEIRVVNLDGVVNENALFAIKNYDLKNYVDQQLITHYTDWTMNINLFKKYYKNPLPWYCFSRLYISSPTTNNNPFILYKYRYWFCPN